jgi:hypothetical protein
MSEASREKALAHAVATHGGDGHEVVLKAAAKFAQFIEGTDAPPAKPAAVSTPAKSAATAATKPPVAATKKPVVSEEEVVKTATKKAAAKAEAEEPEAAVGEGPKLEEVEAAISELLGANLRKQAVALLAEFGAKSASGVPEDDRAAFLEKAQDLLLGG